jgi:hypothetical protein
MTTPAIDGRILRSDWDNSRRTNVVVDILLRQLGETEQMGEREDIVKRLTTYVQSFREDEVDYPRLNAALAKEGFAPLPHDSTARRRPISQMSAEVADGISRYENFLARATERTSRGRQTEAKVGDVVKLVTAQCGEWLSPEELESALRILSRC